MGLKVFPPFSEPYKRKTTETAAVRVDKWPHEEGLLDSILPQNKSYMWFARNVSTNCPKVVLEVPECRGKRVLANEPWNYGRWEWKSHIRL